MEFYHIVNRKAAEGHWEGVRVEAPNDPLGRVTFEGEGYGSGSGFLEGHQGRVRQHEKEPPGGRRRGG